jgi:6-phosphofructokinase 1
MVVVAEGFKLPDMDSAHSTKGLDGFNRPRLGGIAEVLAPMIEERTGIETRATVLGHIQRGGTPTAFDRVLATRLGMAVSDLVADKEWGHMVALHGTEIARITFDQALANPKTVPLDQYQEIRVIFG